MKARAFALAVRLTSLVVISAYFAITQVAAAVELADVGEIAASLSCAQVIPQPILIDGAESFTYKNVSGRDLRIHGFKPANGSALRPAILFFFGGGWTVGTIRAFQQQATTFAARGFVAALADYRVACRDKTTAVESLDDARDAYRWLRKNDSKFFIDPRRIVLAGGSAGGHLALTTAILAPADGKTAALVLFNPVVDLVSNTPIMRVINLPSQTAERISPNLLPIDELPPTIIFHGTADRTVPVASIRNFCSRLSAAGRRYELHEYDGQDHGFYNNRAIDASLSLSPYEDTLARSIDFLKRLGLVPPP